MDETLTQKQREAVEALEGARRSGVSLSDYAKAKGLELRPVYDAIAALRRRGALPPSSQRKCKSGFVGHDRGLRLSRYLTLSITERRAAAVLCPARGRSDRASASPSRQSELREIRSQRGELKNRSGRQNHAGSDSHLQCGSGGWQALACAS